MFLITEQNRKKWRNQTHIIICHCSSQMRSQFQNILIMAEQFLLILIVKHKLTIKIITIYVCIIFSSARTPGIFLREKIVEKSFDGKESAAAAAAPPLPPAVKENLSKPTSKFSMAARCNQVHKIC